MFNPMKTLKALCETSDRLGIIQDTLSNNNIPYTLMAYPTKGKKNLVIWFRKEWECEQVYGAHYDVVPGAPGANDNGASIVVLLQLAIDLTQRGFAGPLAITFFDAEEPCNHLAEDGSWSPGSLLFGEELRKRDIQPELFVILDVVGYGDRLVYSAGGDPIMAERVRAAYPKLACHWTPGSDDVILETLNISSILLCVLPEKDAMDDSTCPRIWSKLHTANDNLSSVDPRTLEWLMGVLHEIIQVQKSIHKEDLLDKVMDSDEYFDYTEPCYFDEDDRDEEFWYEL